MAFYDYALYDLGATSTVLSFLTLRSHLHIQPVLQLVFRPNLRPLRIFLHLQYD